MPHKEVLLDNLARAVKTPGQGELFFSTKDLRYAYA